MGNIQINNLSFRYDGMTTNIFDDFSLNIDESWRLGLIGRNGRGKTTFLRLLLGELADHGAIQTSVQFNYFPQPVTDPTQNTVDVLTAVANIGSADVWKIQLEMDKLKLNDDILDRPFATLSPGEQTKALLAALFIDDNTFQLIDEPTNHLDAEGRQTVADYLRHKRGFIVVSHDRYFIDQVIDHVLSIDRAKVQLFVGNYETWQREFNRQIQSEQHEKAHLQTEIKSLTANAAQVKQWAGTAEGKKSKAAYRHQGNVNLDKGFLGHKAAKVMKRAKSTVKRTETAIDQKRTLLKNVDDTPELTLNYQPPHQDHILMLDDFQVAQNHQILNAPIFLDLRRGQRVVLSAPNGFGKTTIVHAILGDESLIASGHVTFSKAIHTSYLTQSFETLTGSLADYAEQSGVELPTLLNTLRKLGFERSTFAEDLTDLSMGQKRKVSLARSLCEPANFYIWDEPLNYLDVITRQQIQDLILKVQPTMLVIDHDREFVKAVATSRMALRRPNKASD